MTLEHSSDQRVVALGQVVADGRGRHRIPPVGCDVVVELTGEPSETQDGTHTVVDIGDNVHGVLMQVRCLDQFEGFTEEAKFELQKRIAATVVRFPFYDLDKTRPRS